jgi:F-type H+-transporting ATPase subunit epsilon
MVARLVPAELGLHPPGGEVQRYAQGEGWLEVFANRARVLIAEAIPPDELDAGELRERLEEAEQRLGEAEEGSVAHEMAERQKRRFEAFLEIVEGSRR